MKQLLYTSCQAGQSLCGAPGFQIRAASAGIGPERMRAAVALMAYGFPANMFWTGDAPESLPVRLAFLKIPNIGPVVCHSVYAGLDPTTDRPGNFFSHLLLDVPPSVSAAEAIQGWDGKTWRRCDGPFDAKLPDLAMLPAGETLSDRALRQFLSSDRGRNLFRFVLAGFATTEADLRIFLAAPSHEVAMCVYGLTRVLPQAWLGTLTFSTYESQPLTCAAKLVGTWVPAAEDADMPSACYGGRAVGYNSYTGRSSTVPHDSPFVDVALNAVVTGVRNRLDRLRMLCDQCGIDRPGLLNLVCRAESGEKLEKDDLRQLAAYPCFVAHWLSQPASLRQLLHTFAEDPIDVVRLASQCGVELLDSLEDASLQELLNSLIECRSEQLLTDRRAVDLLHGAVRRKLADELRDRVDSVLAVRAFLDRPLLNEERLARTANGLKILCCPAITILALQTGINSLVAQEDQPVVGSALTCLSRYFGPLVSGETCCFYRRLLAQFRNQDDFWTRANLIATMIGVGLGATESAESPHAAMMAEDARDLAEEVACRSKRRVFALIDRQSRGWPAEARLRWNLFAKFVRPRSVFKRIAGNWKKSVVISVVLLALGASITQLNWQSITAGGGFSNQRPPLDQSEATKTAPRSERTYDRSQP